MGPVRSNTMDSQTGWFHSPVPSRVSTPIPGLSGKSQRHFGVGDGDEFGPRLYRSRSRMRPDRNIATSPELFQGTKSTGSEKVNLNRLSDLKEDVHPSIVENDFPYPKDEPGEEMSEPARVWRLYIDEATKFDAALIEGCNRGIDVLLVFTGLFSAVLTTFIIQSFQMLIADPTETTNALLSQLLVIQASAANVQLSIPPEPSSASRFQMNWVNGLWFAALSCSLSTALISMLAKQWLQAYIPPMSGSPLHRARQRQSRYMHLESWRVMGVINALPLLLHVALLLFFAGLIVLLWKVDLSLTIATWIVVASAYSFYFASIWLPLLYPDCPYQHPLSDHFRKWFAPVMAPTLNGFPPNNNSADNVRETWKPKKPCFVSNDDILDASALVWLFTRSTDKQVISAALQAIAGLPRDFTAMYILQSADALPLVEQAFQYCFEKDTTVDLKWHLHDIESASLFCRAWMNLTRGTSEQWPLDLLEPLWKLQDQKSHADAAATASCAIALSSPDTHLAQWELLSYLSRYAAGDVQLTSATVCCLLDSIIEILVQWEMPTAVIGQTTVRAVPTLLRLLQLLDDMPTSNVHSATALALYIFTKGPVDLNLYRSEERRRVDYCEIMLTSLSTITTEPSRFGLEEPLLDIAALELCRLASPVLAQSQRFPNGLRDITRASLFEMFMAGRIGPGRVPDSALADVLHLLNQIRVKPEHQSAFVKTLVITLLKSSNLEITSWSVRLLKPIFAECSISVIQTFIESNGVNALLRAAKAGDIDYRRLQVDSWRTLCVFINTSVAMHTGRRATDRRLPPTPISPGSPSLEGSHLDSILRSDFFETLCSVIVSRRWWLFEVSGDWLPTLASLCRLRPHEPGWWSVIKFIADVGETGQGHDNLFEIMDQLETIVRKSPRVDDVPLAEEDEANHIMTMEEQRLKVRQAPATDVPQSFIWFET